MNNNFKKSIIENSEGNDNYESKLKQWEYEREYTELSNCICGHRIKNIIVIKNKLNNRELLVGKVCINKIDFEYVKHIINKTNAVKKKTNIKLRRALKELSKYQYLVSKMNFIEKNNIYLDMNMKIIEELNEEIKQYNLILY
jgi:hypothetical protein